MGGWLVPRYVLPLVLGVGGLVVAGGALGTGDMATALVEFENGGFDAWANPSYAPGWNLQAGSLFEETTTVIAGSAARIDAAGLATIAHDAVEVSDGDAVTVTVQASSPDEMTGNVRLVFYSDQGEVGHVEGGSRRLDPAFGLLTASATVPQGAGYLVVELQALGSGTVVFDEATLNVTHAEPSPTPTRADTATPTPTSTTEPTLDATTPSPTSPPGGSASPTATRTKVPTKTPTQVRSATATKPATATKTSKAATATKTPTAFQMKGTPTPPLATSTPTIAAGSGFGGMLANGDFEIVREAKPAHWDKYGGTMLATGEAARGTYAACLESETASTKWLYQVTGVIAGTWYQADAVARVGAGGMASLRISWYASTDGSGSQLSQEQSGGTESGTWAELSTGPVRAPDGARSARVRLVFQPAGPGSSCFDDAAFYETEPPVAVPTPTLASQAPPSTSAGRSATVGTQPKRTATPVGRSGLIGPAVSAVQETGANDGLKSLRISEIMSDPAEPGRDALFEWVELVNAGSEAVDLGGWRIADGTASQVLPSVTVAPGSYIVVAGGSASLPTGIVTVVPPGGQIGNGLGNSGDIVRLLAPDGAVADEVSYGDNVNVFDPAPEAPGANETIGIRDVASEPGRENWAETDRPTPGEPNSFAPAKAVSAVAGVKTAPPGTIQGGRQEAGPTTTVESADKGDDSAKGWIVLGGIAGISLGVAGAALVPRAKKRMERYRGR